MEQCHPVAAPPVQRLSPTWVWDAAGADKSSAQVTMSEALALRGLASGELTQQDLGAHLGLEKSTVSRLVDAMASKGWVDKERDPGNRRYFKVRLTPTGRRAARQISDAIRERHDRILASLTAEERAAVALALTALARAMATELGGAGPGAG